VGTQLDYGVYSRRRGSVNRRICVAAYLALATLALSFAPLLASAQDSPIRCCPIVEIRQYTVTPGSIDAFVELFERYFIEGQEADGITVVGTFRVIDDPNRFFWIRGFPDMTARPKDLYGFYYGPVWKAHRVVANPMLVENDNVLLVRPYSSTSAFSINTAKRPPVTSTSQPNGLLVATIYSPPQASGTQFEALFEQSIRPAITIAGARVVGEFVTQHSANNFPALRIRDEANVFAWFSCFAGQTDYERYLATLNGDPRWTKIRESLAIMRVYSPPEVWRLKATPRSALHC
jgi:hypothetical protein